MAGKLDTTTAAATYAPSTAIGREYLNNADYMKLLPFYAALANRRSARCDIIQIGDSITAGSGSNAPMGQNGTDGLGYLRQNLRARFPVAGVTGGRGFISVAPGMPAGCYDHGRHAAWRARHQPVYMGGHGSRE